MGRGGRGRDARAEADHATGVIKWAASEVGGRESPAIICVVVGSFTKVEAAGLHGLSVMTVCAMFD